jgi:hypothetical protein
LAPCWRCVWRSAPCGDARARGEPDPGLLRKNFVAMKTAFVGVIARHLHGTDSCIHVMKHLKARQAARTAR